MSHVFYLRQTTPTLPSTWVGTTDDGIQLLLEDATYVGRGCRGAGHEVTSETIVDSFMNPRWDDQFVLPIPSVGEPVLHRTMGLHPILRG